LGGAEYSCGPADSSPGCMRVLENTLNNMDRYLLEEQGYFATNEKRMMDIQLEVVKQFDKADRFEQLKVRQREIEAMLDLNKDEKTAIDETAEVV
jgi:hypothetical protein